MPAKPQSEFLNKINIQTLILWIFSFTLAVVIPLIYSNTTVDITLVPQFITLDLFILFSVVLFAFFKVQRVYFLSINPISILILCYVIFSATSLIGSNNPHEGIFELMKIVLWILLIVVLGSLLKSKTKFKSILIKAFTIASFVMAVVGALQITGLAFLNIPGQLVPYGTLGNRNIFVPALLLTLPFVMYEILFTTDKRWKLFAVISGVLNITVVLESAMRTAMLAILLAMVVSFVLLIFFNKKFGLGIKETIIKKLKIGFIVFVFLGIIGGCYLFIRHDTRINTGAMMSMNSSNERIALWKKSFTMFTEHPVNGIGLGNWRTQLPNYGLYDLPHEVKIGEKHYQRPENDFVWTFAETGITGGLCYFGIFVFSFSFLFKRLKINHENTQAQSNTEEKVFLLLMFAALVMYVLIAFLGFPKERTYLSIELAVILATAHPGLPKGKERGRIKIYSLLLILIPVVFVFIGNKLLAGEKDTFKIIEARENNNTEEVISYATKALQEDYEIDNASTPITFYRGIAYFSENKIDEALKDFELAYKVHPYHLHVLNNLATCYETKGEHTKAIKYLKEALRISPDYTDAVINLAAAYNNIGDMKMAMETLKKSASVYTNPQYNTIADVIKGKINDSLMVIANKYYEADELDKASAELSHCIHYGKNAKFQELKKAIAVRRRQLMMEKRKQK